MLTGMTLPSLPAAYADRLRPLLGQDTDAFLASYAQPPLHGLRVNPARVTLERLRALTGWELEPIPWAPTGAYIEPDHHAGAHPYHAAGLYYLQEPTAMAVAERAGIEPGDLVLDIAAAPGGKSTQVAAMLGDEGVIVANEIHPARIKALGENLERWGARRAVITNVAPERLAGIGPVFDRVIVDAPCSGEGLFRRDPATRAEWSPARVEGCAVRQREILDDALGLVRPGGVLVYSTCTFNRTENEDVVERLTADHPEWELESVTRLWPHEVRGEGHTISRLILRSEPGQTEARSASVGHDRTAFEIWRTFAAQTLETDPLDEWSGRLELRGDRLMLATGAPLDLASVPVVRDGLWLGERKPGRFEPSHALALAIDPADVRLREELTVTEARRWMTGEPRLSAGEPGWVLVTVDGFGLGWGKRTGGTLKNHYPKGLRRPA
jgi:16S rRNA C967 or C1407 C5-methylase (RsmB/RsmF family)/NOL1/NOP2/fmu family ribosome biogenesis protein